MSAAADTPAVIERLGPERMAEVHALLVACGRDLARRGFPNWEPAYPLEKLVAEAGTRTVYLCRDAGDTPIATVTVGREPGTPYDAPVAWARPDAPARYVNRLAVHPMRQRHGLGAWCMALAERHARAEGAAVVRLDALATNPALQAFYERLGYVARGRRPIREWEFTCFEKVLDAPA